MGDGAGHGAHNLLFVNRVLWSLRAGAQWHDLSTRYDKWKIVHKRFTRWTQAEVWERIFDVLTEDPDNQYIMIDSTIVRAHQQAACGKGGRGVRAWSVSRI